MTRLDDLLLLQGTNRQATGDEKSAGEDQQDSDRDFPSDGECHNGRVSLTVHRESLKDFWTSLAFNDSRFTFF